MSTRVEAGARASSAFAMALVYGGLWLTVFAWGGSFVAARLLLHAAGAERVALSPTVLAALRFSIASVFFLPSLALALVRRRLSWMDIWRLVLLGQITYSLYFWLQYTGVQQTNAGISSIVVVGLIPVTTAFFSQFGSRERLSLVKTGALLLGFAGVAVIVAQQGLRLSHETGFLVGVLCLVSNAFAFALYSTLSKRWMRTIPPVVMTGGTMLSGAIGLLLLSFTDPAINQWRAVTRLDTAQWVALGFLALACSVAAYLAYNYALTQVPATRAAVYVYFEPVVAVALGALLLGERLTAYTLAGALIIALSVALVHWLER